MATLITSGQVNLKMKFKGSREVEGGGEKIIIRLEKVGESKSPLIHGCGRKLWEKYATDCQLCGQITFPDFKLLTPKKMCEDCSEKLAQMCLASEPEASSGHVCHLLGQKGKSEKGYEIYHSNSARSVHISAEAIILIAESHLEVPPHR